MDALSCHNVFQDSEEGQCEGKYERVDYQVVPIARLVALLQEIHCGKERVHE